MKKLILLFMTLLLCVPALADDRPAIPVELADHALSEITLDQAIATALKEISVQPELYQIRAELARMSDGSFRWVVTVFDMTSLSDGWCVELDARHGVVLDRYTTNDGFFMEPLMKWAAWKGGSTNRAMWRMEEKALTDALYALQPMYGLPQAGDMSPEEAGDRALAALAPYLPADQWTGYLTSYGYLMGGEDMHGIWEICLGLDGRVVYRVNLDAVTGEIYYIETDEAGNG